MTETEKVIETHELKTRIGKTWIHRGLDIELHRHEVLGIIGGAGSGKTLLMHQLIGLLKPESGSVNILGENIHHLQRSEVRRMRRRWGVMFQQGALFSAFNVFDNVAFPLRELKKDSEKIEESSIHELVHLMLNMAGLEVKDAWKYPSALSGGMIKRAALARALVLEPELLFLDEPGTGLDPISAADLDALFIELRQQLKLSIFLITHDLNTLAAVCDKVALLDEGKVLIQGTLQEVAQFDHPYVKRFFHHRRGEEILRSLPAY
jgi:phospholipid/cholesterol/gamma-HCH transport system ATP-binding protein